MAKAPATEVEVGERTVRISNPDRVYFPATGATKLDLVEYYLAVGPGIVNALRERPCMLHRFPTGVSGEKVHQKRVPAGAPPWLETVRVHFPRYGQHADELCVTELAEVIWAVQMSTVEFHPWNSRRADVEKPDEWRIDLDPMPDCPLDRRCGGSPTSSHEVLDELGAVGLAQDVGRQGAARVRPHRAGARLHGRPPGRAGLRPRGRAPRAGRGRPRRGGARTAIRRRCSSTTTRTPATTRWRRRTRCGACPTPTVSTPITWDEIDDVEPGDFTMATVPARFAELGDLHAGIDDAVFAIDELLEWAERDERAGAEDVPEPDDESN